MAEMQFGLMMRAQFPKGDDMQARFRELVEQARPADRLGYASLTKGMHYSAAPWQDFQQFPFLCRIMAEVPSLRINFGLIPLSLHKPLDIAEQIATVDVMSGGRVIFAAALGYREVEFRAFGTTRVPLPQDVLGARGYRALSSLSSCTGSRGRTRQTASILIAYLRIVFLSTVMK